jgi:PAS domain S-box-containing protein
MVVEVCAGILAEAGYQVCQARGGREALACLEAERFDLLVVDFRMPEVDGLTVLRRARELDPEVAAIVITSYGSIENAIEALRAGARDFLRKPFDPDDLLQAVAEALAARQREQERLLLHARLPILEISQALMAEGDLESLAGRLLEVVARQSGAKQAALLLLDQEADQLRVAAAIPPRKKMAEMRVPAGEGLARQALLGEEPLVVEVPLPSSQDPLWPVFTASPGIAAVCVPLHTEEKAIGLLTLSRAERDGGVPFSPSDLNLLSIMGSQIATALENAHLYEALQRELEERAQAEEALRESEEKYRRLVEDISEVIFSVDAEGVITYISPVAESFSGYSPSELIGRSFREFVHPDDLPGLLGSFQRAVAGRLEPYEYRILTRSGEARWVRSFGRLILEEERVVGLRGILADITDSKQAEGALRESEERYRTLFDRVPVGLYRTTPEGQILDINPALLEMMGFPDRETVLGVNTASGYTNPEDRARWQALMDREGVVRDFEAQWRQRDGTLIWVKDTARAARDADGRVLYYEGAVADITERKRAEETARASQQLLERTFDSLKDVVFVVEPCTRTITACNRAVESVFGYSMDEVIGRNTEFLFVDHAMYTRFGQELFPALDAAGIFCTDFKLRRKDGTVFDSEHTVTEFRGETGERVGLVSVTRDITRRVQARQELQARERFLTLLNDITRAALETPNLPAMLQTLADHLGELFGADGGYITRWDEERQMTLPAATSCGPMRQVYPTLRAEPGEVTATASVLRAGRPLAIEDAFDTPYVSQRIAGLFPARSLLALPLVAGGKKLGAALVAFNQLHSFTPYEIAWGEQAAGQIALALAKAQALEAEREQRQLAEALSQAAAAVNSSLDLDLVMDRILEQVTAVIPNDAANIMLIEDDQARIVRWRSYECFGAKDYVQSVILRLADTPTLHHMQQTGEAMVIPDTTTDPAWVPATEMDWLRSYAAAPICVREQVIGFLNVDSATPGFFNQAHLDRLRAFANQASLAVGNARLHEQVQARGRYLETLQRINATLRSALPVDEVLNTVVRGASEALSYLGSLILVPDAAGERLTLGAAWDSEFLDAMFRFMGHGLDAFSLPVLDTFGLPLKARGNPMVRAYLSSKLQTWSPPPEQGGGDAEPALATDWARKVRLAACIPLAVGQKMMGVLVAFSPKEQLQDQEQAMLLALASQAALAIENARLFEQVCAGRDRLQILSRQLVEVQEAERRSLARELHDEIGQALTLVKINLQAALRSPDPMPAPHLAESIGIVDRTLQQVRKLSLDLRPSLLDDLGLVPALRWYVDRQGQLGGFTAQFAGDPLEERLPPEVEIACFRIVQEALTNVMRHAGARQVRVELRRGQEELRLTICDDGEGFDVPAAWAGAVRGESLGLLSMEERVQLLGGRIEFESEPGQGTEIRVCLPAPGAGEEVSS